MSELLDVYFKWQSNLKFREKFKKDPELALLEEGIELSPKNLEKIKAMLNFDKSGNEKLDDRISK